jgi:hypothetical protein
MDRKVIFEEGLSTRPNTDIVFTGQVESFSDYVYATRANRLFQTSRIGGLNQLSEFAEPECCKRGRRFYETLRIQGFGSRTGPKQARPEDM